MAISLRALSSLDADMVSATVSEIVTAVSGENPNLELRRGVLAELLVYFHAVLDTQRQQYIADLLNSRSLLAVSTDPTLADDDVVDDILSNFRFSRNTGTKASGEVVVVVSDDVTVTISEGSVWEAGGKQYVTDSVFVAKVEAAQVSAATDRLLVATPDGNWSFTITVTAVDYGDAYTLTKDTTVLPAYLPPNYVNSYVSSDFSVGTSVETTAEVLARMQQGIAARALSNRVNMAAMVREVPAFSAVVNMSVVGYGDAELVRAYHTIFPIASSGRCDWYFRTQEPIDNVTTALSAVLVSVDENDFSGVWQVEIGRDAAAGVYEVTTVRPENSQPSVGSYEVVSDVRGIDVTGGSWVPDIRDATEAAYTAYGTLVVQFVDTTDHRDVVVGTKRNYDVTVSRMPLIAELQAYAASRDVRPYGGDVLVKAPVPCFMSVSFTVYKRSGQADPDLDGIRTAVAKAVNTTGFSGKVYASNIQNVVSGYLTDGQASGAVDLFGRIRRPDGAALYLRDSETVTVPDDPSTMVTYRTVQFFCAPSDVGITVVTNQTLET